MKYGVVGNQKGWEYSFIRNVLKELVTSEDTIISGGADGVDTFAENFAKEIGCTMIIHFPNPKVPSPKRYFDRNSQIARECDVLVAFDKKSGRAGTKNTINQAKKFKKKVYKYG